MLIEGFVLILVCTTGIITTMREKETLESELHKRGLALTVELSKFMTRPILSHDIATLRRFVNHSMEQDYVRYVIVLDPYGKVLMHSDLSEVGKTYTDTLTMAAVNSVVPGFTDVHALKTGELHCDMFTPVQVSGVRLGTIRLGYSHMAVSEEIAVSQQQIFLLGLLTAVGGGIVAYFLANFISSPIKQITDATAQVANGDIDTQIMMKRNDEIGTLASTFNKMTEDLRRTTVSKDYFDSIIKSMNDTLIVIDRDVKMRSVNQATCTLLEYEEDELIGKDMSFIVQQTDIIDSTGYQALMSESPIANKEIDYVTRRGKRIPMLFSAAVLKNKEGKAEGMVCIARDITEQKRADEALRESEKELHYLSSQLLTAQEKERRRLSIELHDELGQSLMVLKLKLRSIREGLPSDQARLEAECDDLIRYINEMTENVRRISRDLSPSILENLGLSAAIRWLVDAFTEHSNIQCSLEMIEMNNLFPMEGQIILYRIIQECLTNIAKHAQSTMASIVIKKQDDRIFFCVEDNGNGFNTEEAFRKHPGKKGLGLATMYQRARMLGGNLDIWSQEGSGTKIAFTVPLAERGYRS